MRKQQNPASEAKEELNMAQQGTFEVEVRDGQLSILTESGDAIKRTTTRKTKDGVSEKVETGVVAYTPKAEWSKADMEMAPIVEVDGELVRLRKLSVVAEVWTKEASEKADKAAAAKRGRGVVVELRKQDLATVVAYTEGKLTVKGLRFEQLPPETQEKVEALAQQKAGKGEKAKPLSLAQLMDAILELQSRGEDVTDLMRQAEELRKRQKEQMQKATEARQAKAGAETEPKARLVKEVTATASAQ